MNHSDFKQVRLDVANGFITFQYCGIPHYYSYRNSDCQSFTYFDENENEYVQYNDIADMPACSMKSETDDLITLLKKFKKQWTVDYAQHRRVLAIKRIVHKNVTKSAKIRVTSKERPNSVGIIQKHYTVSIKVDSLIVTHSGFDFKTALMSAIDKANVALQAESLTIA